ncbi:uncharacterized protein LOC124857722 isoform X2 [Girardinichthys multiradiatus]|uniref:uncharacterized protein LOC124857722 isoform X2 n=1 Tax=Girardinichthys multiradiatus TaxID=208333 RepID=UPI001FAE7532|nr:uncharacterized protein LOC124857722 isoform X2 [Girardinichthys multiradiatus]XP_047205057.1 uncharacterized protein LOC124857722 isoform X2 [Girardinichthys multiradiatus]
MQSSLNHNAVNMDTLEDDDALFLVIVLLDECKPEGVSETGPEKCVWNEEDEEGNPLPKSSRTEEGRKRPSSTDTPNDTCGSMDPSCAPSTREQCVTGTLQDIACDVARHDSMMLHNRSSMVEGFYRPLPPTSHIREEEGGKFSYHEKECFLPVNLPCCDCSTGPMAISAGKQVILIGMNGRYNLSFPTVTCSCGKAWDVGISDLVESGYWPATVYFETLYAVDLFITYEDLKVTTPGMSRQAFVGMLEQRIKLFGRSGKICRDTMQKSFLEWSYAKFEVERLSQVHLFQCPACTPSMLVVAVDGNLKLYRFKSQPGPNGFFEGVFLAKDAEVTSFVDYIHGATQHNPGKGRCGAGELVASRESSTKSASKVDEEGVMVAVCRHGILLKGLNMFRGEIFAYPLYLQKQLASQNVQFFCSDVVCKYWPYLQRVVGQCPELQDLLKMHPFLSIMHAKAHSWMCELQWWWWGGVKSRGSRNNNRGGG